MTAARFAHVRPQVLSWCAYVMRMAPDLFKEWGDTLAVILMRLMQDLPLEDSATRKVQSSALLRYPI
jgi:hypothetical protein